MEDCLNKMSEDAFNILMEKMKEAIDEVWEESTQDVVHLATLANLLEGIRN